MLLACACALAAACGDSGPDRGPPSAQDIRAISAAVGDIVVQCESIAAGYVAGPVPGSLERDVDALLDAHERVEPETRYTVSGTSGLSRQTTLADELQIAQRQLAAQCAPDAGRAPRSSRRLRARASFGRWRPQPTRPCARRRRTTSV